MGDGTKENPYTREDVLKAIEENSGKTEDLNLSGKVFEEHIDLSDLYLCGIILNDTTLIRANFNSSDLDGAVMQRANLQYATFNPLKSKATSLAKVNLKGAYLKNADFRGADLSGAQFQEDPETSLCANLEETDFRNANLFGTKFGEKSYFYRTRLEGACIEGSNLEVARLGDAVWGNYKIGEENQNKLDIAEHCYRHLKVWYAQSGYYDIAGEFFFREMTAQRKRTKWWPHPAQKKRISWWLHPRHRAWSAFHSFVSGYGERPLRVVRLGVLILLGSALLYFFLRGVAPHNLSVEAFLNSLYYSAVSFTALGYGPWFTTTSVYGWVQGAGAAEAFVGVFTIALFLVTFTRKMRR